MDRLETRHFLVGPEMGEDIEVVLEKGKVLHIKTLTPGIEVGFCQSTFVLGRMYLGLCGA